MFVSKHFMDTLYNRLSEMNLKGINTYISAVKSKYNNNNNNDTGVGWLS